MTGAQLKASCADYGLDTRGCVEEKDFRALLAALPDSTPPRRKFDACIELRFGAFDIDPRDGLPCPHHHALFLVQPFPGIVARSFPDIQEVAGEVAEHLHAAHNAVLANPNPNPFRMNFIAMRDTSLAANTDALH